MMWRRRIAQGPLVLNVSVYNLLENIQGWPQGSTTNEPHWYQKCIIEIKVDSAKRMRCAFYDMLNMFLHWTFVQFFHSLLDCFFNMTVLIPFSKHLYRPTVSKLVTSDMEANEASQASMIKTSICLTFSVEKYCGVAHGNSPKKPLESIVLWLLAVVLTSLWWSHFQSIAYR